MATATFVLDAITLDFHYWTAFAWSSYGAMTMILAANIHLIARLINRSPLQLQKRFLDMLASIACISVPSWACISLFLEGNRDLDNYVFYGVPTMFNLTVLSLASIPAIHKKVFAHIFRSDSTSEG